MLCPCKCKSGTEGLRLIHPFWSLTNMWRLDSAKREANPGLVLINQGTCKAIFVTIHINVLSSLMTWDQLAKAEMVQEEFFPAQKPGETRRTAGTHYFRAPLPSYFGCAIYLTTSWHFCGSTTTHGTTKKKEEQLLLQLPFHGLNAMFAGSDLPQLTSDPHCGWAGDYSLIYYVILAPESFNYCQLHKERNKTPFRAISLHVKRPRHHVFIAANSKISLTAKSHFIRKVKEEQN
ncbi:hypothetical protein EK904_013555 [Melospiza melodia maxima]|nr:hypothetical protein EK904_013555 [Melospiza melodia maxima]